ncbi:hypothetical protein [Sorangium cellulosum]|nr:hypothetical protein [Sorangium cellulosum]
MASGNDWIPLIRWDFDGRRFERHGLDFADLTSLVSYRKIVASIARDLWLRDNSDRSKVPKGFDSALQLQFFGIEPGSSHVVTHRPAQKIHVIPMFPVVDRRSIANKLPEASDVFALTLSALRDGQPPPYRFEARILRQFGHIAESLRDDETLDITLIPQPDHDPAKRLPHGISKLLMTRAHRRSVVSTIKRIAPSTPRDDDTRRVAVEFSGQVLGNLEGASQPLPLEISGRGQLDQDTRQITRFDRITIKHEGALTDELTGVKKQRAGEPMSLESLRDELRDSGGHAALMDADVVEAMRDIVRMAMDDTRPPGEACIEDLERLIAYANAHGMTKKDDGDGSA